MYKIYADDTLIYDSTIEDYKIAKGSVDLEVNKSGTFSLSLYPDHFYYNDFIRLRTVLTVCKSDKIVFRGRILSDVTDYWNNKVITCEGELGFLQDSIIRPFEFNGTPGELLIKLIEEHNAQVDDFKKFSVGNITAINSDGEISVTVTEYETPLSLINKHLIEGSTGGYLHVTHGDDGRDLTPTLNYLSEFKKISSQTIEFGANLKNYTKTVKCEDIATVLIPLGAKLESSESDSSEEEKRLTIAEINGGKDYIEHEPGVALYGRIIKTIVFDDITNPTRLRAKAKAYLVEVCQQLITIELNAVDLHLLDHSIESFNVGDNVRVISKPHDFVETLLCRKQTLDLLKPDNDSVVLGHTYMCFAEMNAKTRALISSLDNLRSSVVSIKKNISELNLKTDAYLMAEQRLASLLAQSFGVFQSTEILPDGSSIHYLHNRPTLENSKTIWKMTADAFGVSTDGGLTWNAGLDSTGNAVLNMLAVIGIDASWINANNLTAISSNLGGWTITAKGMEKRVKGQDGTTYVTRVLIPDPDTEYGGAFLHCEKSDDGTSFRTVFAVYADGSTSIGGHTNINPDGSIYIRNNENTGQFIIASDGSMYWQDFENNTIPLQITKQTDGSFAIMQSAEGYASFGNMYFETFKGETPVSDTLLFTDSNGYNHWLRFENGVLCAYSQR